MGEAVCDSLCNKLTVWNLTGHVKSVTTDNPSDMVKGTDQMRIMLDVPDQSDGMKGQYCDIYVFHI